LPDFRRSCVKGNRCRRENRKPPGPFRDILAVVVEHKAEGTPMNLVLIILVLLILFGGGGGYYYGGPMMGGGIVIQPTT
jgi:hypothetical protein